MTAQALATVAIALGAAPAPAAQTTSKLVGQWQFDEPDGQLAADGGPFGLHGLLGLTADPDGADPARVAGASGNALHFDGDAYVRLPDSPQLAPQALTVEAVIRNEGAPGPYRYVMSRGSRGCFSGSYGLYTAEAGGIAFYIFDGERYLVSATARVSDVWDGNWHKVTGVFDGATVRVFLDGVPVGEALVAPADTAIGYDQPHENTYVGTYVGTCMLPFTGAVDSLRIWSDGLTAQEVAIEAGLAAAAAAAAAQNPMAATAAATIIAPRTLPKASCRVSVSRKMITVRDRSVIHVHAAGDSGPIDRARVAIRRAGHTKIIASKRTDSKGRARIVVMIPRVGRLRVSLSGRSTCSPAYIRVARRQ